MNNNLGKIILEKFLKSSKSSINIILEELSKFKDVNKHRKVKMYLIKKGEKHTSMLDCNRFFLRTSFEYSNPQLTLEELQGIIIAKLMETCGNYFYEYGINTIDKKDVKEISERLVNPPEGLILSFLLNVDDSEPDRYSINPLKNSIVNSGQSAFPSWSVKTDKLNIDKKFMKKYNRKLITKEEGELIEKTLENPNIKYIDMVDQIKYTQLESLSRIFEINLSIHSFRTPLTILEKEKKEGLLHHIIRESHKDYNSIEKI